MQKKLQCWSSAGVGSSLPAANPAFLLHAAVNTNTNTDTNTITDTNTNTNRGKKTKDKILYYQYFLHTVSDMSRLFHIGEGN